jgi:hypothetical protein
MQYLRPTSPARRYNQRLEGKDKIDATRRAATAGAPGFVLKNNRWLCRDYILLYRLLRTGSKCLFTIGWITNT